MTYQIDPRAMAILFACCLAIILGCIGFLCGIYAGGLNFVVSGAWMVSWRRPMHRVVEGKVVDVIFVPESPPPSKHMTSQFPPTPEIPTRLRRALRAGKARVRSNRRPLCRVFDPNTRDHCGLMTMARAAKMSPTKFCTMVLRSLLALTVYHIP